MGRAGTVSESEVKSPGSSSFVADLRGFIGDFARYAGRRGVLAGLYVALGAVLEGIGLALMVPLVGIVIGSGASAGRFETAVKSALARFGFERPFAQLALLIGVFAVLMVARAVVISLRDQTTTRLRVAFVEQQRFRIAELLAAARWDQIVSLHHARVTHVMGGDLQRIGAVTFFLTQSSVAGVMLLVQCALLFALAPALAAITSALILLGGIAILPGLRRARLFGGQQTVTHLSLMTLTAHFLGGLKLAVSQNLQRGFLAEFKLATDDMVRQQIAFMRQQTHARLMLTTVSAMGGGLLVLVGYGVFAVPAATLLALLLIVARMSGPFAQIQTGAQQLAHALPAYTNAKTLERDLEALPQAQVATGMSAADVDGPIVFSGVTFLHGAAANGGPPPGVRDVDLTIVPGETIGIGGPSGAGKTTFADLLVGLYPPQTGRVAIADRTLDGDVLATWRSHVAYVAQEPFLFHDSVRRNLAWVAPEADETQMWEALAFVGADDLVRRMPQGLDTVVGERGTLISGGERQRLALARAILRRPRLLVLDEATSAIDIAGEHEILVRLRALAPRPTTVMIAHRAESLTLCDRVLRMEAGRLA